MIALYFPCWRSSSRVSYIVTCRWLPSTFPAEELLHLYHILLHADDCLKLSLLRASSLLSYIVTCRWLPYTFPAEELLHLFHILLHAGDCLILSLLKSLFTCIIYCYMQMIALYFPCWRAYSLISYIVTCRWLFFTFPAEELLHLYHILLHADDCLKLSLLRASSLVSYIVKCRWLPYTFPADDLLHLYHILLHADDCLLLSLLKSYFTCIIYCYMQMIALNFPRWRSSSLISYIVTCRWLFFTFPAEELLHLYHILLHADDCLKLSLLRASSLVSYIVKCRWLPYTFPADDLLHLYHILLHADDCLLLSLLKSYFTCIIYCYMQMIALNFPRWRSSSLVSYIVTWRWLPYTFPAEELIHLYHILLHADECFLLSPLKNYFTCIIYCYMQMIALNFPCWELLHLYHILLNADDCLIHSLLKIFFTCIIYCYMQMIAFYFTCWRATSLVSYIVTCRWLP